MTRFAVGHAAHATAATALERALAMLDATCSRTPLVPTLGVAYVADTHAAAAEAIVQRLLQRWPDVHWVGCAAMGVAAGGVEFFDEPGIVLMLGDLPRESFRVYSGAAPLAWAEADSALVHADPATPDLDELLHELAQRTGSGYLFGGLVSSRTRPLQFAGSVHEGGLSGVALRDDVPIVSRVTQGCQPIGPQRTVTEADRNVVVALDGEPALPLLLQDLQVGSADDPRTLLPKLRATLVGLSDPDDPLLARGGQFGTDTRVRHLVGLDPARGAVAVGDLVEPGMRLAFCTRDPAAARRDLVRICAEIRDEAESVGRPLAGALYASCTGRGGPHFGAPSAELQIVRHALGDVPLAGFFAAGEIARHHLYGYTGVLTAFIGER
ncbi:MAG: FIST C-terminal domain-containing protein [Rubrivivax sp.]|nr:FIST C-terminal domain-containing protein [Rubrivivax sp.]